jgi:hypothetical protein
MKVGVGVLILGAVGSVGTFARISRVVHTSGVRSTSLLRLTEQTGLTSAMALQRAEEASALAERVATLQRRLKERHPTWYP